MKRCQHQQCQRCALYHVDGRKAPVFCKHHAEDGMVDVWNRRCSRDRCTRRPSFYFEGAKTAMFCKQHAEDGMVSKIYTLCSHDCCTRRPSFNFEGYKTPVYCKEHAEDGMVNVYQKRCSRDSCFKSPSFNVWGSKTAVYCRQHAEDGMVNVLSKRCSHDSCRRHAYYNGESSTTPTYCQQHAEEGMVNVRTNGVLHNRSSTSQARIVPTNVVPTPHPRPKSNSLDCSVNNSDISSEVVNYRKRSRGELDGNPRPNTLYPRLFKVDLVQTARTDRSREVPHTRSTTALRRQLDDNNTVGTIAKQTRQGMPPTVAPILHEYKSEEPIKTEMGLNVSF